MPVQDTIAQIERNGCLIDREILKENINIAQKQIDGLEAKMIEMVPERILSKHRGDLRFSRPQFMKDIIFDGFKCKPDKKFVTKVKKEPQLTEDHLKTFSEKVPFIPLYLKWKGLSKLKDSYLSPLDTGDFIYSDGRIYPSTLLIRTVTGRTVILDPPMQTYPQHGKFAHLIKECIVADPGWVLGARDLSQSELRIAGWLAHDKNIMDAVKKGIDLHINTAAKIILSCTIDKVTKEARQQAKPVNFGLIYGMAAESLQDYAKNNYGVLWVYLILQNKKSF
jgi:DNA polymerase-1